MPVKRLQRVRCSSLRQKKWFLGGNIDKSAPSLGIMQRTHLLKILVECLLDTRVVGKVDCFDLAAITAFVHDLRLASNSLVLVTTHRPESNLMNPGPSR